VDYLGLNNATIENKYHLPRIDYLVDQLQEVSLFSTIGNHLSGYHSTLECGKTMYQKESFVHGKANFNSFGHAFWINPTTFGIHVVSEPHIS
jgi:hypothetical protein